MLALLLASTKYLPLVRDKGRNPKYKFDLCRFTRTVSENWLDPLTDRLNHAEKYARKYKTCGKLSCFA